MPTVYHFNQLPLFPSSKVCKQCHIEKPLEEFYKDRNMSSGYKPTCKACYYARRRELHPPTRTHRSTYSMPFISTTSKVCYICEQEKPLEEFHKDKHSSDGRRSKCKECVKEYSRIHQEEIRTYHQTFHQSNKDRLNAESRIRYYANRERRLTRMKVYQQENRIRRRLMQQRRMTDPARRQRVQMYHIAFREAHPEIVRARNQAWRLANPLKAKQGYTRHRARKRQATMGEVNYERILARDGYHCYICDRPVRPDDIHFDHVIPLSRNGPHSEDNIKVTHSVCNLRKGAHLPEELTHFQRRGPTR